MIAALASLTAMPVLADSGTASADVRIRANARVRIGGHARVRLRAPRVRVRVRRPRVRVRHRVRPRVRYQLRVGGGYYYGWRYAAPPPPRCTYECAPNTTYYAPRTVGVYARPHNPKRWGVGIFAGGMNVEDREATSDIGLIGRFRLTRSLTLEGEVAKSELEDGSRVDRRLGAALLYDLAPSSRLSPHILVGAGAVRSDIEGVRSMSADQVYGEVGVGIGWRLTRSLELAADIRAGSREANGNDEIFRSSQPVPIKEDESYTRGRLSAILHF